MRGIETIRKGNSQLAQKIVEMGGFIISTDVPALIQIDRLMLVLVRCGNGRFLCPIQDLTHFMGIIKRDNQDYVRDVSLPA